MTTEEFSNTFDTLLNSYSSQAAFGEAISAYDISLDEYEKSVLLTQAQDIILKTYFTRNQLSGEGFDESARRQIDFSELISTAKPSKGSDSSKYDERGIIYEMPKDILITLNERIKSTNNKFFVVIPINYKEYDRQMSKAFAQPLKKQAWRLYQGGTNANSVDLKSEIIPIEGIEIAEYTIRYIRRPKPIILTDLNFGDSQETLDIDGVSTVSECELNPIMHMDILQKAVEIAFNSRRRVAPQQEQ